MTAFGGAELRRDGTTIHSDVEISYVDAILGTTTKVRLRTRQHLPCQTDGSP